MKRIFFALICLLALNIGVRAQQSVSIGNISVEPGGVALLDINYQFTDGGSYVGFMFQVSLPEGLTLSDDPDDAGYPWYDADVAAIANLNITTTANGGFAATPRKASSVINGTKGVLMRLKVKASNGITPGIYTAQLTNLSFNLRDANYNVSKVKLDDVPFSITVVEDKERVTVSDMTMAPGGEAMLNIGYHLPADGHYVGFMFKVSLPEGLSLAEDPSDPESPWYDEDVNAIAKLNITTTANGGFAATPKNATSAIVGNDGVLMRLKVKAEAGLPSGKYKARITDLSFNLRDDAYNVKKVKLDDVMFSVSVMSEEDLRCDVNGDGQINVADLIAVINVITGPNNNQRADVNADNRVDIMDILTIINRMGK